MAQRDQGIVVRYAESREDLEQVYRLRYEVLVDELGWCVGADDGRRFCATRRTQPPAS